MSAVSNRKFPYFKLYINNLSKYELEKTQDKVELSAYSDDYTSGVIFGRAIGGNYYGKSKVDGVWNTINLVSKDDLLISASGTGPTDWTALETTVNMPFKIWNVTKASTSKGAPAGCYDYGTLIALVATAAGDRWSNTLIYLPDNNNNVENKVYVRSGISTKWLAISGTDVNSVS